jgi:hypothetical protein
MLERELASDLMRGARTMGIRVRYPAQYRSSGQKLKSLLLTSPTGQTVPLVLLHSILLIFVILAGASLYAQHLLLQGRHHGSRTCTRTASSCWTPSRTPQNAASARSS